MRRALALALLATSLLGGCGGRGQRVARLPAPGQVVAADGQAVQITALKALPPPDGQRTATPIAASGARVPPVPQPRD